MSKKDYERIAAVLKATADSYGKNWNPNLFRAVRDVAMNLAPMLQVDNAAFDRTRFLTACGMTYTSLESGGDGLWQYDPQTRGQ